MNAAALALLLPLAPMLVQDDPFDRIVSALATGDAAAAASDSRALYRAAIDLEASGAQPLGHDDVARDWLARARRRAPAPFRNRALGPGYLSVRLEGAGTWRLDQTFLAGQRARVAVVAARSGPFVMRVTDDDRQTVCQASPSHRQCDWVPAYTARFTIEIRNPGPAPAQYYMVLQ